jgi:hypothetical protein
LIFGGGGAVIWSVVVENDIAAFETNGWVRRGEGAISCRKQKKQSASSSHDDTRK